MLKENIQDTKAIAKNLDFDIILSGGSLLGAYREGGKPIKGDEDDVDFAVSHKVSQMKYKEVLESFLNKGFTLKRLRDTVVSFERNGSHVDFLFYRKWNNNFYYESLYYQKRPFALFIPSEYLDNLSTIEFCGVELKCPEDIEGFLAYRYGDWKTPVARPEFNFQFFINKGITKWLE